MSNLKIQYWPIDRLKHFAGNARHHSEKQLTDIARSIQRFGFVNPVLVDESGEIIAGHGRAMAADKLFMEKVPVIVLTGLSDGEKRALRLADNRIAENSTWDEAALNAELRSLRELEVSTEDLGWDDAEMEQLLREATSILPDEPFEPPTTKAAAAPAAEPNNDAVDDGSDDAEPLKPAEPKASDDDYSMFELVMLHENKVRLLEALGKIRAEHLYEKLEDALMHMVRHYDEETDA